MKVRFSILMPVYNREKYVRQAVESILSQTFTDCELIAIDDGSTDGSAKILKSFGNRIKLIQQRNQGPEVARNAGAAVAQGEYLAFLDSDDFLFPSEALLPNPVEVLKYQDYISKTIPLTTPNSKIVIKKSVFDKVGGLRNSTPLTFHNDDLYILLKTGTYGPCIVVLKPYTLAYRMHEENSIKNVRLIAEGVLSLARSERRGEYPGGNERRWERYAVLGGRASTWALRYCWRGGQKKLALRLLFGTAPMVFAALWNKSIRYAHTPEKPIVLPQ